MAAVAVLRCCWSVWTAGYRSVAYLKLPTPLTQLAVCDAMTSLKVHREYTHAYGLMHNAWKAFGNERKAWQAAELGRLMAEERGETALVRRFSDMKAALSQAADDRKSNAAAADTRPKRGGKKSKGGGAAAAAGEVATDAIVVEARGPHPGQQPLPSASRDDSQQSLFLDAALRSLTSDISYRIPHMSTLPPSFSLVYPTCLSAADVARGQPMLSSLCQGKAFEVAFSPSLGRHLIASRAIRAGELVLSERPLYAATWCEDVCTGCWRTLSKEDGKVVDAVECAQRCGMELYCSARCRDERWPQHELICGHSWRELRERAADGHTTSALIWLLVPLILSEAMREVKRREKDIRTAAIRQSLAQQQPQQPDPAAPSTASPSPTSPLHAAWDVLCTLPLRHLVSHHELGAGYLASSRHDFERLWAMSTLLNHWFIVTPPTSTHSAAPPPSPTLASAASLSYLPHFSFAFFEHCISRLLLNAHAMHTSHTPATSARGAGGGARYAFIAVGLLCSLFAHSCFPNCQLQSDGQEAAGRLVVHAGRAIRKGETLTLAYVDTGGTRLERAQALFSYGFACNCSRCKREKGQEQQLAAFYAGANIAPPPTTGA